MEWFADLLKHYPELAIFLTLAFGFWIGKFKIGKFSFGNSYQRIAGRCINRTIAYRYRGTH